LSLWANALSALRSLGLGTAIERLSVSGLSGGIRTSSGKLLTKMAPEALLPLANPAVVVVHRAELHEALLDAVGPGVVQTAARCVGFTQTDHGVSVRFADGREERGALLIGADGIRSVVRDQLFGAQPPRYSGQTAWRAVVKPDAALLPDNVGFELWGRGAVFGIVPMSAGRVYWFAAANAPEGAHDRPNGRKAELLERFRGWFAPIESLIASTDESLILRNDLYDRPTLDRWSEGRVAVLGDAAHPMMPNLGQGACQALEDAVALGAALRGASDIQAALRAYEHARIPRANNIVQMSRRLNQAMQISNPLGCWLRDHALGLVPQRAQIAQFKQVVGSAI
jgi:2-polyprenyl-6-methoxyphenol hydroxylase-like FAD-dependent oxidoreductase